MLTQTEIEEKSQELEKYHNNLDSLLDIKTTEDYFPGLTLTMGKELHISREWDWYLVDKHPTENIFKVVGLNKTDSTERKLYILGKNADNSCTFLYSLDSRYLETSNMKKCLKAAQKTASTSSGVDWGALAKVAGILVVVGLIAGAIVWWPHPGPSTPIVVTTTIPTTVATSTTVATDSTSGLESLVTSILPIVFAIMILMGIFRFFQADV